MNSQFARLSGRQTDARVVYAAKAAATGCNVLFLDLNVKAGNAPDLPALRTPMPFLLDETSRIVLFADEEFGQKPCADESGRHAARKN